ncbi:hypothetical protein PR048_025940 [Dryococelus australis]|uniref:Uncharacterized protein n=1 Tax=Dryococelus australis TaxID=614101 RepID=A0ABQ9GJY2_9NEOP|nr:hypothetical protein PR048_025940 [Dryococelus australis]
MQPAPRRGRTAVDRTRPAPNSFPFSLPGNKKGQTKGGEAPTLRCPLEELRRELDYEETSRVILKEFVVGRLRGGSHLPPPLRRTPPLISFSPPFVELLPLSTSLLSYTEVSARLQLFCAFESSKRVINKRVCFSLTASLVASTHRCAVFLSMIRNERDFDRAWGPRLLASQLRRTGSDSRRGCPADFRMWEPCRTIPLFGEFSRESPVSSILTSIHPYRLSRDAHRASGLPKRASRRREATHRSIQGEATSSETFWKHANVCESAASIQRRRRHEARSYKLFMCSLYREQPLSEPTQDGATEGAPRIAVAEMTRRAAFSNNKAKTSEAQGDLGQPSCCYGKQIPAVCKSGEMAALGAVLSETPEALPPWTACREDHPCRAAGSTADEQAVETASPLTSPPRGQAPLPVRATKARETRDTRHGELKLPQREIFASSIFACINTIGRQRHFVRISKQSIWSGKKREIPEKNPPTSGIVRHDSHLRESRGGPGRGFEPGLPLWEAITNTSCRRPYVEATCLSGAVRSNEWTAVEATCLSGAVRSNAWTAVEATCPSGAVRSNEWTAVEATCLSGAVRSNAWTAVEATCPSGAVRSNEWTAVEATCLSGAVRSNEWTAVEATCLSGAVRSNAWTAVEATCPSGAVRSNAWTTVGAVRSNEWTAVEATCLSGAVRSNAWMAVEGNESPGVRRRSDKTELGVALQRGEVWEEGDVSEPETSAVPGLCALPEVYNDGRRHLSRSLSHPADTRGQDGLRCRGGLVLLTAGKGKGGGATHPFLLRQTPPQYDATLLGDPVRDYNFVTNNTIEVNVVSLDRVNHYDTSTTLRWRCVRGRRGWGPAATGGNFERGRKISLEVLASRTQALSAILVGTDGCHIGWCSLPSQYVSQPGFEVMLDVLPPPRHP